MHEMCDSQIVRQHEYNLMLISELIDQLNVNMNVLDQFGRIFSVLRSLFF